MPAWIYVLAVAAVLFAAWFAFARRWVHALRYSWRQARHLADVTQAEVIPGAEYIGSMSLDDDPHGEAIAARALRYGDIWAGPDGLGDWREQTRVELAPETLDLLAAPVDPGPGDGLASSSPPPGPDQLPIREDDQGRGERVCADDSRPAARADLTGSLSSRSPEMDPGSLAHGEPGPDWLEAQRAELFGWVRAMVPQVTGWSVRDGV